MIDYTHVVDVLEALNVFRAQAAADDSAYLRDMADVLSELFSTYCDEHAAAFDYRYYPEKAPKVGS